MTIAAISRRQLLRGDLNGDRSPIRPPWAIREPDFTSTCTRCGACIEVCPEHIVHAGDGGFPHVDFALGGCSFCADCLTACEPMALRADPERDCPWMLTAHIGDECLAFRGVICRSCGEACDEGAIRFRPRVGSAAVPTLVTDGCTGCGYCVRVCPAQAVKIRMPAPRLATRATT